MVKFRIANHAAIRARQRGYLHDDLNFVVEHGTEVTDGYLLCDKDVVAIAKRAKSQDDEAKSILKQASRLRGTYVPFATQAMSIYRPCSRKLKHLLGDRRFAGRKSRRAH